MKCEGGANNCIRCQKAGRACLPQVTLQKAIFNAHLPKNQLQDTTPKSYFETTPTVNHKPAIPDAAERELPPRVDVVFAGFDNFQRSHVPSVRTTTDYSPQYNQRTSWSTNIRPSQNDTVGELPSIFSTPPVDTVTGPASPTMTGNPLDGKTSSFERKRKRAMRPNAEIEDLLTPANSQRSEDSLPITKKDMRDMVDLFCQVRLRIGGSLFSLSGNALKTPFETLLNFILSFVICS